MRSRAVATVVRWTAFVAVKRMLRLDTFPSLPLCDFLYGKGLAYRAMRAPAYRPIIAMGVLHRVRSLAAGGPAVPDSNFQWPCVALGDGLSIL